MVYWICHKPLRFQSALEAGLQAAPATVRELWTEPDYLGDLGGHGAGGVL
jgi:hypothetical protein